MAAVTSTDPSGWDWKQYIVSSKDDLLGNIKSLTNIEPVDAVLAVAIATAGIIAIVNTYNTLSDINELKNACVEGSDLSDDLKTQAIILGVLGGIGVIIGVLMLMALKTPGTKLLSLSILILGFYGIVYSIIVSSRNATSKVKLWSSWIVFILLAALGIYRSFVAQKKIK